ncbi:MAG: type II toxin-antitoxin system ParD family antitoxin [Deltaproteobacteria bacterium]|nr:type II toxin-antitoxin system ParD family antitoxin [Deltaproteobacteria bacterium]
MNVSLPPRLARFVASRVAAGRHQSASEVVREGLRLLEERENERAAALARIRDGIAIGLDQANKGLLLDGEEVFRELGKGAPARRRRP